MSRRAFSLIELIGVVAILVILTSLVLSRIRREAPAHGVVQTVNEAHIVEAVAALQGLEAATTAYVAQFGSLSSPEGTPGEGAGQDFGQVLLIHGLLDRPFHLGLGTNCQLRLHRVTGLTAASPIDAENGAYDLDQDGRNDVIGATHVVEVLIFGVDELEARALNERVDGPRDQHDLAEADLCGRVIYGKPGPDGRTDVLIHLLHR